MDGYHIPVLLEESLDGLDIKPDGVYVDCTFGGGGHSCGILSRLGRDGMLVAFDQDADAEANLPDDDRVVFVRSNFRFLRSQLRARSVESVDGILADLGVSSHHFDDPSRGFSFRFDSPLDMRMNGSAGLSARDVVNTYDHADLLRIFRDYGQLQSPHKIAGQIISCRDNKSIETTGDLIEAVKRYTPAREESKFLAKLFQAVRIEVNGEMEALRMMLEQSVKVLSPGGRLAVITYHSLEDRLVKNFIRSGNCDGLLERDIYGNASLSLEAVGKPLTPSPGELERNSRSRSARLRVARKI